VRQTGQFNVHAWNTGILQISKYRKQQSHLISWRYAQTNPFQVQFHNKQCWVYQTHQGPRCGRRYREYLIQFTLDCLEGQKVTAQVQTRGNHERIPQVDLGVIYSRIGHVQIKRQVVRQLSWNCEQGHWLL